ncbi:helix-turn-helix transcriptional regulator [Kaistella montana]|uniref:Helix-turn-helix transcriptional regulator n=1 Tax=Kaistella montana TaxID=1849733 RepID=A0ABW5KBE9_9FLAO|nr:WYL domain-containing protein [Kaistella montana]MCQ4035724.1 WYL domain-containing protein [Kaistella montana]
MPKKSENLLKVYSRLKRGPVNIEILKKWIKTNGLSISERTIYRYLHDLENIELPDEKLIVTEGEKNKKTWKIEYDESTTKLNEFDLHSYLLFKNLMPLPLVKSREATFDRIENLFYKNYSKSNFEDFSIFAEQQISNTYFYELLSMDDYQKTLNDAIWCIQNKREIELLDVEYDYTSIPKSIHYPLVFLPLHILYHRGVIHLSGYMKESGNLMIIALNQIKEYHLTNIMFDNKKLLEKLENEMQSRFGITGNMNNEIYDIEIEFSEYTGEFIKHHFWHHSQNITQQENGNYIMKLRCGINRELVGWVFQWMSNAKVLKPNTLKELVVKKHHDIIESYKTDDPIVSNNSFLPNELVDRI